MDHCDSYALNEKILQRICFFAFTQELIQNAEDAGAKEIKLLFDDTEYGTASLINDELKEFQVRKACKIAKNKKYLIIISPAQTVHPLLEHG